MRYYEGRDESAELLRMLLPLMSRHPAAFSPLSYAVWYEYVSGNNQALQSAIDEKTAGGQLFNDADIEALFDNHVALRDIESSMGVRAHMQKVIERVSEVATEASNEVTQYNRGLDEIHKQLLRDDLDRAAMTGLVESLLDDTNRIRGRTGNIQENLQGSSQEVVRLREQLEMAQGLALTDPLTGLLNRRGFEQMAKSLQREGVDGCSVMIFDIDHFKTINDQHGHLLGDRVLAAVANVIRQCVGDKGKVARMGGEEFAAVLPGVAAAKAAELAERVRAAVEKGRIRRQDRDEPVGGVTISAGVAVRMDGEKFVAMMDRADRALYKAKQDGRNRITISTRSDN